MAASITVKVVSRSGQEVKELLKKAIKVVEEVVAFASNCERYKWRAFNNAEET